MDNRARAGHYIKQATGYKAFIPNLLSPVPDISIDQEICPIRSQGVSFPTPSI
jgi:hypothetical protein